jgi:hypothetical protein
MQRMTIHAWGESSSATDEVDDFQAVSVVQWSLRPLVAGDDLAVQFDGYAVWLHAESFDESA